VPLSKRYIDEQDVDVPVDFDGLRALFVETYDQVVFTLVMGSATQGTVQSHSDLDLAIYASRPLSLDERVSMIRHVSDLHQGVRCDLGMLRLAEPVYRFEALKGRLLFTRDQETWLRFYSVTCREYESQMFHYEKQRCYRIAEKVRPTNT